MKKYVFPISVPQEKKRELIFLLPTGLCFVWTSTMASLIVESVAVGRSIFPSTLREMEQHLTFFNMMLSVQTVDHEASCMV